MYGETVIGNFEFFGTVYLYTDEFIGVCMDTFGYLEAQVACTRIDYPFASDLYAVDRYAETIICDCVCVYLQSFCLVWPILYKLCPISSAEGMKLQLHSVKYSLQTLLPANK